MGAKFRWQQPLGRYIADFYCGESRLVIELDGAVHSNGEQGEYDRIRTKVIDSNGIKVLRFKNEEVEDDLNGVLNKIAEAL
jgi:very-short-patch-repair endonuclease